MSAGYRGHINMKMNMTDDYIFVFNDSAFSLKQNALASFYESLESPVDLAGQTLIMQDPSGGAGSVSNGVLTQSTAGTGPNVMGLIVGLIVGYILNTALTRTEGNVKATVALVGAALGGAPFVFLNEVDPLSLANYPLGLLVGMLIPRFIAAREQIVKDETKAKAKKVAWIDIVFISAFTIGAFLFAAW